jgi:hypothetical protein
LEENEMISGSGLKRGMKLDHSDLGHPYSIYHKKLYIIIPIIASITICLAFVPHDAYALCSYSNNPAGSIIHFNFCDYDRASIATITVNDNSANNPTQIDTVPVTVHSNANLDFAGFSSSTITVTLKETGINTGVFQGKIVFVTANTGFAASDKVTITQKDPPGNTNTNQVDTVTEYISTSHAGANPIQITMTETGANTGIFQGKLHFGSSSSSAQNTIWAIPGDIVGISDPSQFYTTNVVVTPNPDSSLGVLTVNNNDNPSTSMDDTITATYGTASATVSEGPGRNTPGGGGGGIVSPGLVLDAAASLGATGGSAPPPPMFELGAFVETSLLPPDAKQKLLNFDPLDPIKPSNYQGMPYYPLTIDGNNYLIGGYANTLDTATEQVGKPANLTFTTISRPIVHMALYTNLHNISDEIYDSDTYMAYDKGQQLQIVDPHGFFSKVTIDTKQDGNKQSFLYSVIFAKSMPKSNIILRAWDDHGASQDVKLFDAWQAIESSSSQKSESNVPQTGLVQGISPKPTQDTNPELVDLVKEWAGYSSKSISDSEMLSDMGINATHIPSWYMKSSKWFVSNDISADEFVNAIKYMYDKGIIH